MVGGFDSAAFEGALDVLARKTREDEASIGAKFPYVTNPDGSWDLLYASQSAGYSGENWSHGNWFCGFWVGLLLIGSLHKGDQELQSLALERMNLVAPRAKDPNTHDIGFIFLSSALPAHHITGDDAWADVGLEAARQLRARLVRTDHGAYISSWGPHNDERGRRSSAIDTMANLPLLYWAAEVSHDNSFLVAAELHAQATERAFIRDDLSTVHAVNFNLPSGTVKDAYTFQGYADDSCWSRGQGWSILGMAETARYTRSIRYLDLAHSLADHFLARLGKASAAPWDFDDPAGADATLDTAASAIVANALIQIAYLEPDAQVAQSRLRQAADLLERLCRDHLAHDEQRGLLKHGCYSKPHGIGPDAAVLFGDYYFAEALLMFLKPGALRALPERLAAREK
ncbi:glycoside hydrolase family 88 protein [Pelagibacterium luteolum]|uniref:Unsaturated chondroitin disaccharide hydrolase n=1 Tax=Pelagibacterium luteolum TaxID=440168 RepID=A0A1G7XKC8_9HYPH|nr:glycoside hydrolase family 88 protein [Pelagibacterium luteolum]SDG84060.1 unsaturated chondroitin disaccharide hydrolase [Pelagibacterium luteolum]